MNSPSSINTDMIRFSLCFAITAALILFLSPGSRAEVVDRIVAVVNDDIITLSDVDTAGKEVLAKVNREVESLAEKSKTLQQVRLNIIQTLIDEKIIDQEAKKRNLEVSEEEAQKALNRFLEEKKLSLADFRKQLAAMGSSEEQYLENLKKQILASKLVNTDVRSKIIISGDQIRDHYHTHYLKTLGPDEYYILQIGCVPKQQIIAENKAEAEAQGRAEKIRALAISGQDFRELARKYSELPSAADGGDLGIFKKDEMPANMREALDEITPGQVTRIIKSPAGYQFFKLLANQPGSEVQIAPLATVEEEIREKLYQEEIQSSYDKWLKELRNQAFIQISL